MMFVAITSGMKKIKEARRFAKSQKRFTPDVVILREEVANGKGRRRMVYHVARPARIADDTLPKEWKIDVTEDNVLSCG